ncbi:MAG TPA: hypothetical protein VFH49_05785, partial [Aquabacterium sp.]|nr:hypothetical protein [Aquabacterium sp.]
TGVTFGTDNVPVDAYFDAQRQAIVIDDLVPEGGRVILAGQVMSTGNGKIRAAYGYANVDIVNDSNYDLIVNRVDATRDRVGKITIIDTARILDGAGNDQAKREYTVTGSGVTETVYDGDLVSTVGGSDGSYSRIQYTLVNTINHGLGDVIQFAPRDGLHYVWVEGQEKVKTEVTKYEKNSFNLFGGNTGFEDWLSSDNSYKWRTVNYTDETPLLESEAAGIIGGSGGTAAPVYADDKAYTVAYEQVSDPDVNLESGVTTVWDDLNYSGQGVRGYRYIGAVNTETILPGEDFSDAARWQYEAGITDGNATYNSSFKNYTMTVDEWETGGGWLREKTYHTKITIITGLKDYYTHTLKADYPIDVGFIGGSSSPFINLQSKKDLLLQGDVSVADGGTITLTSLQENVLGAEQTAIFNDAPTVSAVAGEVRLLVEGGNGTLEVTAGKDIHITAITEDVDSSLTVGQVVTTGGDVTLVAKDGIEASNAATSLIKGNRIELSAASGDIGGDGTLRIDSHILGTGGLAALAGGDIALKEINGVLNLIRAQDFATDASVEGGGDVSLSTTAGSILDKTLELDLLINDAPLTAQQLALMAALNSDADPTNDITADSFKYPVSPG